LAGVLHEHFELRPRHLQKRALLDPLQFRRHSIRGYQHALNAKRVERIFIGGGTGGRDDEKTGNQKPETRKKRSQELAPETVRFARELIHGRKSSNILFAFLTSQFRLFFRLGGGINGGRLARSSDCARSDYRRSSLQPRETGQKDYLATIALVH